MVEVRHRFIESLQLDTGETSAIIGERIKRLHLDNPLERQQRLIEAPGKQQRVAAIVDGVDIIGLQRQGPIEGLDGTLRKVQLDKGIAKIVERDRRIWAKRNRLFVTRSRLPELAHVGLDHAQIAEQFGRLRVDLQRPLQDGLGLLELTDLSLIHISEPTRQAEISY